MTLDQQNYVLICATVAGLPAEQQQAIKAAAAEVEAIAKRASDVGPMAVMLVAAKLMAEA